MKIKKERDITFCLELNKRRQLNADLQIFQENVAKDEITESQNNEVLRFGKGIVLKNYFNDLLFDELKLSELINDKKDFYLNK